jgi:hypothetical protein
MIDPADSVLGQLVNGINTIRAQFRNADRLVGTFENIGDILSTPQLTEQSPFLNTNNTVGSQSNCLFKANGAILRMLLENPQP